MTNRLTDDGTSRQCIAWAQDGFTLAIGKDMSSRIDERADKSYSTQVYCSMTLGGTRMEEVKGVEIACNEKRVTTPPPQLGGASRLPLSYEGRKS